MGQSNPTLHTRMTRRLLHVCILSSLLYLSNGFHTDTCNHQKAVETFSSYNTCIKSKFAEIQANPCLVFSEAKICALETFTPCYGDDATLIASTGQLELAKTLRKLLPKFKIPLETIDLFFQNGREAPTKQETANYTNKMFWTLDFTETDKKCSREAVEQVQLGLQTCMTDSSVKIQVELKSRVNRARGNLKNTICDTLYETSGECLRTEFPTCFTEREIVFMKEDISFSFKSVYDAVSKILDKSHRVPEINIVECLERGVTNDE